MIVMLGSLRDVGVLMIQTLKTSDLPMADRFPAWRDIVANGDTRMRIASRRTDDFIATATAMKLGPVMMFASEHPPVRAERTPDLIRRWDPDTWLVVLDVIGSQRIDIDDQTVMTRAGDIVICHSSWSAAASSNPSLQRDHMVFAVFDRQEIPFGPDRLRSLLAVPLSDRAGIGSVVAAHLCTLATADGLAPEDAPHLGRLTLDLISLLLARRLDDLGQLSPDGLQNGQYAAVQAFIRARLHDPDLTPELVASAHHMSLRSLQRLFEANGTSVANWIRSQRLSGCRWDLTDRRYSTLSVAQIASRWGIAPAHLSRAFRAVYGLSPYEFRRAAGDQSQ